MCTYSGLKNDLATSATQKMYSIALYNLIHLNTLGHFYSLFKHIKMLLMHLVVLEAVGRQEVQKVEKFF